MQEFSGQSGLLGPEVPGDFVAALNYFIGDLEGLPKPAILRAFIPKKIKLNLVPDYKVIRGKEVSGRIRESGRIRNFGTCFPGHSRWQKVLVRMRVPRRETINEASIPLMISAGNNDSFRKPISDHVIRTILPIDSLHQSGIYGCTPVISGEVPCLFMCGAIDIRCKFNSDASCAIEQKSVSRIYEETLRWKARDILLNLL